MPILDHISFHVHKGEFVSILGPSGLGKSTILNLLTGILPCTHGNIYVDDISLKVMSISERNRHFAYMPQNDLLLPWKNILDNVCLYGSIHGHKNQARKKALENFSVFGLDGYEKAYPSSLSGGMRQRAAFLRTTLCDANILLLDEPFGALDVISRADMQDWLLSIRKQLNRTVLLVTHDIDEAIYLSDRILLLGHKPASITKEISIEETQRTRSWLFKQNALKQLIYESILEGSV